MRRILLEMTSALRLCLCFGTALLATIPVLTMVSGLARGACEFALVKQQIDNVLDKDKVKGAKFRREVSEGADSTTMMESLVAEDMRERMDICRFEVGEYLARRGFPPFH